MKVQTMRNSARLRWVLCGALILGASLASSGWAQTTIIIAGQTKIVPPTIAGPVLVQGGGTLILLEGGEVTGSGLPGGKVTVQSGGVMEMRGGQITPDFAGVGISVQAGADVTLYGSSFEVTVPAAVPPDPPTVYVYASDTIINFTRATVVAKDAVGEDLYTAEVACAPGAEVKLDTGDTSETVTVIIDIKPGSEDNSVNLGSNGVVPVAILSTADFDATTVVPETVTLAGAGVAVRGKGNKYLASAEDVNGDGLVDLSLKVETENLDPDSFQNGYAILKGETSDGQKIEGSDKITIVPPDES